MPRTRSYTTLPLKPIPIRSVWTSGAINNGGNQTIVHNGHVSSTMTDDGTPLRKGGAIFKDCLHTKLSQELDVPSIPFPNCGVMESNFWFQAMAEGGINPYIGLATPRTLASVSASKITDAFRRVLPTVDEGVSLVNFFLELKDLRRLFHVWTRKKNALGNISDAFLNYSFGWGPLIRDIAGLYKGLQKLTGRLRWLRRNAGKRITSRLRWVIEDTASESIAQTSTVNDQSTGSQFICTSYNNAGWRFRVIRKDSIRSVYTATMSYRYKLPNMSLAEMKLRGFLDALGLNWSAKRIWDATKWSYVVDWVVDVGGFLRTHFSKNNLDIVTEVLDCCHAVKSVAMTERDISVYNSVNPALPLYFPRKVFRTVESSRYERARVIPDLGALTGSVPGIREFALTGSLLGSKFGKSKSRKSFPQSPRKSRDVTDPW